MFSAAHDSNVKSQKSAVDAVSRNQVSTIPIPRPPQSSASRQSSAKGTRPLPWKKNPAQTSSSGKSPMLFPRASPPSLAEQRISDGSPILGYKRGSPPSPVLGSGTHETSDNWDQIVERLELTANSGSESVTRRKSYGFKRRSLDEKSLTVDSQRPLIKRKMEDPLSSIAQPFKRPRLPSQNTPTPAPLERRSSSALGSSSARAPPSTHVVQAKAKRPPNEAGWAKFVRRESRNGSLSRLSTPTSTPGKRYCVKPKALVLPTELSAGRTERESDGYRKAINSSGSSRGSPVGMRSSGEMSSLNGKGRMVEPETQAWDM
jgi:hypothetical protein